MNQHNADVEIFNSHTEAGTSIKELQQAGFDMTKLSLELPAPFSLPETIVSFIYDIKSRFSASLPHHYLPWHQCRL
jgi:hypothetical protein